MASEQTAPAEELPTDEQVQKIIDTTNWSSWEQSRLRGLALATWGARATNKALAEELAAMKAANARLAEAVAMLPNRIEPNGVTPRPPGNSDWWSTAVAERRQRKAAEAALKAAREALKLARETARCPVNGQERIADCQQCGCSLGLVIPAALTPKEAPDATR
jgi:hypothetical protein